MATAEGALFPDQLGFFADLAPHLVNPDAMTGALVVWHRVELGPERFAEVVRRLVDVHPALRSAYTADGGVATARLVPGDSVPVRFVRAVNLEPGEQAGFLDELQTALTASIRTAGPASTFANVDLGPEYGQCVIAVVHHLAYDAHSGRVLSRDLRALIEGRAVDGEGEREHARLLQDYAAAGSTLEYLPRFANLLAESRATLPPTPSYDSMIAPARPIPVRLAMPASLQARLLATGDDCRVYMYAVLARWLTGYFGDNVLAAVVGDGRSYVNRSGLRAFPDRSIMQKVGWLASTGWTLLPAYAGQPLSDYWWSVAERVSDLPAHWSLLHRYSARTEIEQLMATVEQGPQVWTNYIAESGRTNPVDAERHRIGQFKCPEPLLMAMPLNIEIRNRRSELDVSLVVRGDGFRDILPAMVGSWEELTAELDRSTEELASGRAIRLLARGFGADGRGGRVS